MMPAPFGFKWSRIPALSGEWIDVLVADLDSGLTPMQHRDRVLFELKMQAGALASPVPFNDGEPTCEL